MVPQDFLFSSGSVSEGHPDKIADQIADGILDAVLEQDPYGRVACEIMVATGMVLIAGEFSTLTGIDMRDLARQTICEIGYTGSEMGFDWRTCAVLIAIDKQSQDIARGVDEAGGHEQGAGDQGMMFGYACNETETLIPAPIYYAHKLVRRQAEVRKKGSLPWLWPDARSRVALRYEKGRPVAVESVVFTTQHSPDAALKTLREAVMEEIIKPVLPAGWLSKDCRIHINPGGRYVIGGPRGERGLTGHKLIADTYGGMGRHGGGALSGKDPSKVDRSGAYAMRYLAKNIVAAGLAERCELQISYAIGRAEPTSFTVNTFGSGKVDDDRLRDIIRETFDLKPRPIIEMLDLLRPVYRPVSAYGHFGRDDIDLAWEKTDRSVCLHEAVGHMS